MFVRNSQSLTLNTVSLLRFNNGICNFLLLSAAVVVASVTSYCCNLRIVVVDTIDDCNLAAFLADQQKNITFKIYKLHLCFICTIIVQWGQKVYCW